MCVRAGIGFFFFQAEDGIRDIGVTGVQTCALPISSAACAAPPTASRPSPPAGTSRWARTGPCTSPPPPASPEPPDHPPCDHHPPPAQIGRASCRERV